MLLDAKIQQFQPVILEVIFGRFGQKLSSRCPLYWEFPERVIHEFLQPREWMNTIILRRNAMWKKITPA